MWRRGHIVNSTGDERHQPPDPTSAFEIGAPHEFVERREVHGMGVFAGDERPHSSRRPTAAISTHGAQRGAASVSTTSVENVVSSDDHDSSYHDVEESFGGLGADFRRSDERERRTLAVDGSHSDADWAVRSVASIHYEDEVSVLASTRDRRGTTRDAMDDVRGGSSRTRINASDGVRQGVRG
jgi:hypothetical protein